MPTPTLQSKRGRDQSVLKPRGSPSGDCSGGPCCARSLGPHPRAVTHSSVRGGDRGGAAPGERGCKDAQADASPAHRFLQGCGLHPLRDGHRGPLFPGSTVKEELHLIFRLLGQSPAAPRLTSRGAPAPRPARTLPGTGEILQGWGPGSGSPLCPRLPTHPPPQRRPPGPGLSPSQPLLISPGTPRKRAAFQCDGRHRSSEPTTSQCLPSTAARPRSQVAPPPALSLVLHGPSESGLGARCAPTGLASSFSRRLDPDGINLLSSLLLVVCSLQAVAQQAGS